MKLIGLFVAARAICAGLADRIWIERVKRAGLHPVHFRYGSLVFHRCIIATPAQLDAARRFHPTKRRGFGVMRSSGKEAE